MSSDARPNLLRALAQRKTVWLAVPAIAAIAVLVLIGRSAVTTPVAEAEASAAVATTAPQPVAATPPEPVAFTSDQKKQIEDIIKSYLVANPEIFLDVQNALEEKMEKQQAEKLKVAIADNAAEIYWPLKAARLTRRGPCTSRGPRRTSCGPSTSCTS